MNSFKTDDIRVPLLLLVLMVQAFLLVRLDGLTSPNRTEIGHMAAALRLCETGTFDLFHANPPLLRMLTGLAVQSAYQPRTDWTEYSPNPLDRSEWACGVAFIKANDFETVKPCFFLGRVVCIPIILLGGYFGYRYARELFGEVAGFVFLILWTFSPFILGWGTTICPDVPAAATGIIALYSFRHWILNPTGRNTVLAGLLIGLLPLLKLTWVIAFGLFPLLYLLAASERTFRTFGKLCLMLLMTLFVLNLGYLFDGSFKLLGSYTFHSQLLTNADAVNRFKGTVLANIPVPLPEQFVLGFDTQRIDFEKGLPSYLLGKHSQHGWRYYYPVVLLTKETLGTLVLAGISLILCFNKNFRSSVQDELILLIPMLVLFLLVCSQTGFALHSRYMIPVLPFFYLWISRAGRLLSSKSLILRAVVPVCLLMTVGSSLSVYPYSMSYFNEAVGGAAQGHRYLLGSNVDWGQDLYELKDYLDAHPDIRPLSIAVSNIYPLETLNIHSIGNPPKWKLGQKPAGYWAEQLSIGPQPGWFLLGTNDLYNEHGDYEWLRAFPPAKRIGYSLYLYNITLEEANRLREKDKLPMLIEDDNPVNSE